MIAEQFLANLTTTEYWVFKIIPSKFGLTGSMIARDEAECFSAPLHSYIFCDPLPVEESDVFTTFDISFNQIQNWEELELQLSTEDLIQELDYGRGPRIDIGAIFRSSDGKEQNYCNRVGLKMGKIHMTFHDLE